MFYFIRFIFIKLFKKNILDNFEQFRTKTVFVINYFLGKVFFFIAYFDSFCLIKTMDIFQNHNYETNNFVQIKLLIRADK